MESIENLKTGVPRDASTESIWQQNIERIQSDTANEDIASTRFDVLIIGGGITGLTTAMLLQEAG